MNKYVKMGSVVFGMIALTVSTTFAQISAGINPKANLGAYKTFAWLEPDVKAGPNPMYKSELLHNTVKTAVNTELTLRGMKEDEQAPDALIQFHTYTQQRQRTNYNYPGGFYPYFGGWGWGRWGGFFPYGGLGWGAAIRNTNTPKAHWWWIFWMLKPKKSFGKVSFREPSTGKSTVSRTKSPTV